MSAIATALRLAAGLALAAAAMGAEFATPGAPAPANIDEIARLLRQDPYDLELLISYGTSKGGSAGHLALAIRDEASGEDLADAPNFYPARPPGQARGSYPAGPMARVQRRESR